MDRRLPGTTAPVAAPLADGVGQLASAGGSFVGSALAAGVDQALRTGDDAALFAAVANMTAGLADVPARSTVAANPSPAEGAASAGQPVIGNCQTVLSQAGEGLKLSPSPVGDTDGDTDDPELLEYQRTHRWERVGGALRLAVVAEEEDRTDA